MSSKSTRSKVDFMQLHNDESWGADIHIRPPYIRCACVCRPCAIRRPRRLLQKRSCGSAAAGTNCKRFACFLTTFSALVHFGCCSAAHPYFWASRISHIYSRPLSLEHGVHDVCSLPESVTLYADYVFVHATFLIGIDICSQFLLSPTMNETC